MQHRVFHNSTQRRRGSLMIEMVVCTVLLSVASTVLVPGIYAVHRQRRATKYDTLAVVELNNLAARVMSQGSQELTLSTWFATRYPDVRLTVSEITSDTDQPLSAFRLQLTRQRPPGQPEVHRSLVVWTAHGSTKQEVTE